MQTCILLLEGGSWASLISDLSIGHQSAQGVLSHTSCIVNAKWISIFPPTWISLPTILPPHFPIFMLWTYLSVPLAQSLPICPCFFHLLPFPLCLYGLSNITLQWPRPPSPLASLGLRLQPATPPPHIPHMHSKPCSEFFACPNAYQLSAWLSRLIAFQPLGIVLSPGRTQEFTFSPSCPRTSCLTV